MGQTSDIRKRLIRHNQGKVALTKSEVPWELVLRIDVNSRSEAMHLESKIKKRGVKRYLDKHFGV